MARFTLIAVLTLLYLQWGDSATPLLNGKEYVFHYTGVVNAKNTANDDLASQWTVAAKLVMQSNGDDIVMKFEHMKANLYNGREYLKKGEQHPIPVEAHHIYLPFVVHYHNNGSAKSLSHQLDDALWSVNMKRAIASIIQIDSEHLEQLDGHKFHEENIYGNCEPEYSVSEEGSVKIVSKTINGEMCTDSLYRSSSKTIAVRSYHFKQSDNVYLLTNIESNANITYRIIPGERSHQQLVQSQSFQLMSTSAIAEAIDVTKTTESAGLEYLDNYDSDDETFGRNPPTTPESAELARILKDYSDAFRADFQRYPLVPGDIGLNNSLKSIFDTLSTMDLEGFATLEGLLTEDEGFESIFLSILPYLGTNESLLIVKEVLRSLDGGDDLLALRLMATLPKYVNGYSEELFDDMSMMMNLNVTNRLVRNAGILSFANMVGESNPREQGQKKYSTKYSTLFAEAEDYEDKMTYLLGLANMCEFLEANYMMSIITNTHQSHHLRSLAAYGFRRALSSNPEKMFETLWPIVKNQTEHFEVRVAVLDLFLHTGLEQSQFDTVVDEFKEDTNDPYEQHLQNFMSTSLAYLSKTEPYKNYLSARGLNSSNAEVIPSHYDTWTGNYRVAYADPKVNFGGYFQVSSVANPITNAPTVLQLSVQKVAKPIYLNLNAYTAYIKVDGIAELNFAHTYFKQRPNEEIPIPQLVDILKKFDYKLIEEFDLHIEIVLFYNEHALFGVHVNKGNVKEKNPLYQEVLQKLLKYEIISFPKLDKGFLRSDFGTPVRTEHTETEVESHAVKGDLSKWFTNDDDITTGEWNYRSLRYEFINLECYNPLLDVNIGVYKYSNIGQRVHLPFAVNVTGKYFTSDLCDDDFNLVADKIVGITVDDIDKLQEYCPSCDTNIPLYEPKHRESMLSLELTGIGLNVSTYIGDESVDYLKALELYKSNARTAPLAEPVLFFFYGMDYLRYLGPDFAGISVRSVAVAPEISENLVTWYTQIGDVYNDNDPYKMTVSLEVKLRDKQNATVMSSLRFRYAYMETPLSSPLIGQVEQKHKVLIDYNDDLNKERICFERNVKYPNRRADIWSISPIEPTKGTAIISGGVVKDKENECNSDSYVSFTDIFEPAKDQIEIVENMPEYKECKTDATGLKYTPPTKACVAVHQAMSRYSRYNLYVDLSNAGKLKRLQEKLRTNDYGIKLVEYNYIDDDRIHVVVSKDVLDALVLELPDKDLDGLLDFEISLGSIGESADPTMIAYDEYDSVIGLSTSCDIVPSQISTFTGKEIDNYATKAGGSEIVAYVECFNETRGGLTVQKYSDKKLGFTMWSGDDKLVTSISGDKLKVVLNGEEINSHSMANKFFKVYYLADDVIYVTNRIIEVYYNTEYISIKVPTLFNKFVCGLCAHEDRRMSSAENEVK